MSALPKVLLSAGMIQGGLSGVGRYVVELAPRIARLGVVDLYVAGLDSDRKLFQDIPDSHWVSIPAAWGRGVKNLLWHQLFLRKVLKQGAFDLLHIPSYRRIIAASPVPQIATVHDCAPFRLRDKYGPMRGLFGRQLAPALARRCQSILTVSEFTRQDVIQFYGIDAGQVQVVYNGLSHDRYRPQSTQAIVSFKERMGLQRPFFLYISRLEHPGKNHIRLIEAFERFQAVSGQPMDLVLAGAPWHGADVIQARVAESKYADTIRLPGFVDEVDLPLWYAAADALVFPSLMEGFGLPVAEAMACGTTVLSSDKGSLPEVGGDAAIYFAPESVESMLTALQQWASEPGHDREGRIERGYQQTQQFDWDLAANSTCQAYQEVLTRV